VAARRGVDYLLPHLLETSAGRHPEGAAVRFGERGLTYARLFAVSRKLAAVLVRHGLQRGDRVGIYFPKSESSPAALFGALLAGGIYVPLDPLSPRSRVAAIIKDCGVRHLITTSAKLAQLAAGTADAPAPALEAAVLTDQATESAGPPGARVVTWAEVEAAPPLERPSHGVDTDLAYVLYTSGSTGTPKGVMITHRAALTFVNWTFAEFGMSERDVVWNHAPLHFDLSIFDVFTTVKAGGTVVPVPEKLSTFPIRLAEFLRDEGVTVAYCVPSALTMMLLRGNLTGLSFPALRAVLFAGEVFPLKYLREVKRHLKVRMTNLYGPTETNVCTFHDVTDQDVAGGRNETIPIGRSIANYEVFAVRDGGGLAAPGEEGELYARGPGLCSGYWGDADKTRRLLVPNPLGGPVEELVVRTGDIVIPLEDGVYRYVGRRDNMVKSKGYRIELGEIETALYAHPRIVEAAVVAIPDEEVTNRLKAYVVTDPPGALSEHDVQQHCRGPLPRYMVPEMVEFRDGLPKTSTGKVDRPRLVREHVGTAGEVRGER
jgi:amino acid adenylation domain-containing protein